VPMYEYLADDGTLIELLRPIADADAPVPDPEGKGRSFKRAFSSFAAHGASTSGTPASGTSGGCCPCGKSNRQCSGN